MLAQISPADKVSIVAIARNIQSEIGTQTISAIAAHFGVPLMSEARNRKDLAARIQSQATIPAKPQVPSFVPDLISILCQRSGAIIANKERRSYADWFKNSLVDLHDKGISWIELASLTGIIRFAIEFAKFLCKAKNLEIVSQHRL